MGEARLESMVRILFILVLLLGGASCRRQAQAPLAAVKPRAEGSSGDYSVSVYLSPEHPRLVDALELRIVALAPESARLAGVDFTEASAPEFAVKREPPPPERMAPDGRRERTFVYALEPWLAERYSIPAITATFAGADGQERKVTAQGFAVEIAQPTAEEWEKLGIDDAQKPLAWLDPAARRRRRLWRWGVGAASALLALGAAWLAWRRHRRRLAIPPTPYETALLELAALEGRDWVSQGEFQRFYEELSSILRRYLEARFEVRAPKLTTEEFLNQLVRAPELLSSQQDALRQFLTACDFVKFAAARPTPQECGEAVAACRNLLSRTSDAVQTGG